MTINYRVLSLGIIVSGFLIKTCSFYWIFAVVSCVSVFVLTILSVLLSSSSEQSLKVVLKNPLEQHKVRLGLNCKLKSVSLNPNFEFQAFYEKFSSRECNLGG